MDANKDGRISAAEIKNAVAVLRKLDKNGDGDLAGDEIRAMGSRGQGSPRGRDGMQSRDGQGAQKGRQGRGDFAARLKQADKNGDGRISKDEAPDRLKQNFGRIDTNGDGTLDEGELKALAERFQRGGRGGASKGRGGDKSKAGESGGKRPKRPGSDN